MSSLASPIIVIWALFWIYWIIKAFDSKKSVNFRTRPFAGIRLLIFLTAVLLIRSISHKSQSFGNYYLAKNNEILLIAGFVVFLFGLLLAIWARLYLGKNWGMPMSEKQEPELVTTGPYRFIRHPIYSGFLLATIGSIISGSVVWVILLLLTGPYFIYSAVVEERFMIKQFPKVYPNYKSKTKMLVPYIF